MSLHTGFAVVEPGFWPGLFAGDEGPDFDPGDSGGVGAPGPIVRKKTPTKKKKSPAPKKKPQPKKKKSPPAKKKSKPAKKKSPARKKK